MSWQEDLHRLESDLAMGRLSAEDYRRQRDELLAAANAGQTPAATPPMTPGPVTPGPMTPGQGVPAPMTPGQGVPGPMTPGGGMPSPVEGAAPGQVPPGTPPGGIPGQQPQTPFPPAFKWAAQPPNSSSERTQTMHPVSQDGSSDATQVVPGTGMDQRTQAIRPGDADRTQVVHSNPFGQPQQQQSPWPGADQSNLYSSDNMPNWNTAGAFGDWPKQGPEVFDSPGNGRGGRRVLLVALIIVVLAGLGVGGWLLFSSKGSSPQANGSTTTTHAPTPTTTPGPRPAIGLLVNPPGFPSPQAFTPAQLQSVKPLPKPDLDLLNNTSLTNADYVVSKDGSTTLDLWAFQVQDNSSAQALVKSFTTDQLRFGFAATDIAVGNGRYLAYTSQQQSNGQTVTAYRLHYVVGNQVIRVEAFDTNATRARSEFVNLLNLQTKLSPASNS